MSGIVEYHISRRVKEQFDAFMSGFSVLAPQDLVIVLLPPVPTGDAARRDDWIKFMDYCGYEVNDEVVQWFRKCLRSHIHLGIEGSLNYPAVST